MASPLFPMASKAIRRELYAQMKKSWLGQILAAADQARSFTGGRNPLTRVLKNIRSLTPKQMFTRAVGTNFSQLTHEVLKYSKGGSSTKDAMNLFLKELGPVGSVLQSMVQGRGGGDYQQMLGMAVEWMRAEGMPVKPGVVKGIIGDVGSMGAGKQKKDLLEAMAETLRKEGYEVIGPGEQVSEGGIGLPAPGEPSPGEDVRIGGAPAGQEVRQQGKPPSDLPYGIKQEKTKRGTPRKTVDMPMPGGKTRRFPVDHPIVTGKMIRTPNSTNVYEVGYDIENNYLYVRFQSPNGGAGSLYRYFGVMPERFLALYRVREAGGHVGGSSSPGTWVWARLRVRGSRVKHQVGYELVGIMNNYVPRQATFSADGREMYKPRTVQVGKGKYIESSLPSQTFGSPNRGQPNRGNPNRG